MQRERLEHAAQALGPDIFLDLVAEMVDYYRNAGDIVTFFAEMDAVPASRRFAPAASGAEAAQTSDRLAEDDAGSERVSRAPPWELVIAHDDHRGDHRPDEPAVIDPARTEEIEREDLTRVVAVIDVPFGYHHQRLRSDQRGRQYPQAQVVNLLLIQPVSRRQPRHQKQPGDERHREQKAVGVKTEIGVRNFK